MVIISNPPNGSDSTQLEPSESVEEPPIRGHAIAIPIKPEKPSDEKVPGSEPTANTDKNRDVCAHAHTFDAVVVTERLGVVKE